MDALTTLLETEAYGRADFNTAEGIGGRDAAKTSDWEIACNEHRVRVKALTKGTYAVRSEATAAAEQLLDGILAAGDWRAAVHTVVAAYSVDSSDFLDEEDDQDIKGWFGAIRVNLLPPLRP